MTACARAHLSYRRSKHVANTAHRLQAPGAPHAVVTSYNALVVGCFFYTAEHFARSIDCVRLAHREELPGNESITAKNFEILTYIVEHLDLDGLFTNLQLTRVWHQVRRLLHSRGCVGRDSKSERLTIKLKQVAAAEGTSKRVTAAEWRRAVSGDRPLHGSPKQHSAFQQAMGLLPTKDELDAGKVLKKAEATFLWACLCWLWRCREQYEGP